ncbi:MAG: DNA starvation/stationary phase protection protein [Merismopedia sp. SIO2A8]|nr:DNA starvation/stationary phase protection protein [Symploca sp. SIO2B6]NET50660.1 DNA starvation/stationary phase protection protein [Merismopedia sp. SIO2A8]
MTNIAPEINNPTNLDLNISIDQQEHRAVAEGLSQLLANTYILYLKTHGFHWNVTGNMFYSLHQLFEEQYQEMATAVDEIAERIRMIGFPAPGSYSEFIKLSSIPETEGVPTQQEMMLLLVKGNEALSRHARSLLQQAEAIGDAPTADLLTRRIAAHQRNVWMLRSLLQE